MEELPVRFTILNILSGMIGRGGNARLRNAPVQQHDNRHGKERREQAAKQPSSLPMARFKVTLGVTGSSWTVPAWLSITPADCAFASAVASSNSAVRASYF